MNRPKHRARVRVNGVEYLVEVEDLDDRPIKATVNGQVFEVHVEESTTTSPATAKKVASQPAEALLPPQPPSSLKHVPGPEPAPLAGYQITAPLPGDIVEILVKPGDSVAADQVICSLEAMKMKNEIRSVCPGVVASVDVVVGQAVSYGDVLVRFE